MAKSLLAALCSCALLVPVPALAQGEYDECEANLIAAIGSSTYQFNPTLPGHGSVQLYTVLSYQRAAAQRDWGQVFWRLEVRDPAGRLVHVDRGLARIDTESGLATAEAPWDGRDLGGRPLPAGRYAYTFKARFLPDRIASPNLLGRYENLAGLRGVEEAYASTRHLLFDYDLTAQDVAALATTSCQVQQNTPLEAGFPYNFYYGSTHAHSNWSDGGQSTASCSSGNAYGSGTHDPAAAFAYARDTAGMDFWIINEHNHLINDAVATNDPPVSEAKVRQRYADGRAAASAATVEGSFIGLYGMEWGVTSNADQGHVTLIETPTLFGWETCTNCNGPNPECAPGSDCYFDVFTPKRFGYLTMYQRSVENPSPAGPLGIMCHPSTGQFDNYAFDQNADAALQGIAVRSGLAFSTASNCADANMAATDYSPRWQEALNRGFHLGPVADHDSHCVNYGVALPTRTVYLIPSGASPVLTKTNLLSAHKTRHFFATEDSNAQLVFATSDGAHLMGDVFNAGSSVTLRTALYDPNGEGVSLIEIWRGQIGGGVPAAPWRSVSNQSSDAFTDSPAAGTYYYYVHAVQADGHDVFSAPVWISFSGGGCSDTTAPAASIAAPANGAALSCTATTVQVSASDASGVASVEVQIDGGAWSPAPFNSATGFYESAWNSSTASSGSHTINARATDASCNGNVGNATAVSVTVDNSGCGGSGLDVSGWKITQANATYNYNLPAGTVIPADGYVVVARDATKAAFESFWGVTLGPNVVYVNSVAAMPVINGSENYTLSDAGSVVVEGPTISMASGALQSIRRNDPCQAAGLAGSWTVGATTSATPGSGAGAGAGCGVVINEFADASGTGNFVYEFVELHYDAPAGSDTQAPTTSITAPASGASVGGTTLVSASASDNVGVTRVEFYLDGALQATDATSPYEWSWNTTTASNGVHSLTSKAYDAASNAGTSAAVSVTVNNDTTPPTTSITAPASGTTISGTATVTASASDDVGVTRVEFYLDGAVQATDTTSPYEWSWNTTTSSNGVHSLTSKAYDAANNVGASSAVSVTVNNGTDVSNWRIQQANSALTYYIPAGTTVPANGYVVIGRNASKAAFESFWGVTLGSGVVYLNGGDAMPQINGSESYTLYNAAGTKVDGKTTSMSSSGGQSLRRKDPCNNATQSGSWYIGATTAANPGSGAGAGCNKGVVINEFSDASGTGNFVYEFVELHNDR